MCQVYTWCTRSSHYSRLEKPTIPLATQERLPRIYYTQYLSLRIRTTDASQMEKRNKEQIREKGKEKKEKKAKQKKNGKEKERKEDKKSKKRQEDKKRKQGKEKLRVVKGKTARN